MRVNFVKMHGNGNDFVLIDEFNGELIPEEKKPEFVRAISHRNFGIGCDGVLFVQKSEIADARFRYFNRDGSEAEMCGNGIRCFARYVVEEGYAKSPVRVETLAGVLELEVYKDDEGWWVKVDMGKPKFEPSEIPSLEKVWGKTFEVDGKKFVVYAVNTGVPHAVVFVDDFDFDLIKVARKIRYSEVFPQGTNVNFAKFTDGKFFVRTYERGVEDETLSCGTGSVAVAVVSKELGMIENRAEIMTKGGKLVIELDDTAYLVGGASRVAEGVLRLDELRFDV